MTEPCKATTGTAWSRSRCGRPVKEDGLCGIHLAAKRRREANIVARRSVRDADTVRQARAKEACDQLSRAGITARPYYDWAAREHTGEVVVSPEVLLRSIAAR